MKNKLKRMFAAAKKDSILELFVYNSIGEDWYGGGVTPQSVQDAIKAAGEFSSITVHINSPGGDSFDGVAIHNILRQQKVPVNVIVEGLAASAAFTIAMAGDTIGVCDGAMLMLHNAWSIAIGEAKDMRKMADLLEKVSGTMCDMYAKRSGLVAADVQLLMDAETWLTCDEAITKGFATEKVDTTPEKSAAAKTLAASFDLAKFGHKVPDSLKSNGKKPKNDVGCQCPCDGCMNEDCASCDHEDCDCIGCDCPQHDADDADGDMNDSTPKPPAADEAVAIAAAARARRMRISRAN